MTSTTPRIITAALLTLGRRRPRGHRDAAPRQRGRPQTSSLAGTGSSPSQDLRGADATPEGAMPPILPAPPQDIRNPDNQAPRYQAPAAKVAPIPVQQSPYSADQLKPISTPAVATDDDPSPFVYIIPAVMLVALGAAPGSRSRAPRGPPAGRPPDADRSTAARAIRTGHR